jgi:hypothetical protein
MANLNKQVNLLDFAATTSVGTEHWFNWIVRWNGNKEAGTQEDNNIGSTENTVSTSDKRVEEVKTLELIESAFSLR